MTTYRYIEMDCDSDCDESIGPYRTVALVLKAAKAAGWKVRNPVVGDQCPSCQAAEADSRGASNV